MHTPDPNEYDADEPVAHIVQAIDKLAAVPGTPVIDNMLMVAESALGRAFEWAVQGQDERRFRIQKVRELTTDIVEGE